MRRFLLERGGLITLCILALYLWMAPAHVVDGDNAEFSTLGTIGGIAHPSGYPFYLILLRALSWIPGATPAHTAAIITVLLAGLQVLVLHAACRAWGARPSTAAVAVAVFAASPFVMRIYTEAEAYALNGLCVALVLWLAAALGPLRGSKRALALGLVAGLGLANHLTCLLVAPVGLLGVVRAYREAGPRAVLAAIGALAIGLSAYLYCFVTPENLMSWPRPQDLGDLLDLFTRRTYGGVAGFTGGSEEPRIAENVVALGASLARTWILVLLPIAFVAIVVRIARPTASGAATGESRGGWIALAIAWVIAGPILALRFNVAVEGYGLYVVRRFHVLPSLLLVIPVAVGLDLLIDRIGAYRKLPVPGAAARALMPVVVFAVLAVTALPHVAGIHSPAMERGVQNLLGSLPPSSVVLGQGDDLHVGVRYLQLARGVRPDVAYVHWSAMGTPWYRERMAQLGVVLDPVAGEAPSVAVARHVLASGRPLFVDPSQARILAAYPSYPFGLVIRVLPPGAKVPTLDEVVAINKQMFARFDLDYPRPHAADEYAAQMHLRYTRLWQDLGRALGRAGRTTDAAWALDIAAQLAPE